MDFVLECLVLWPRNEELEPRLVHFQRGVVNILTGRSRSGKSSIITIVDYCLGAEKCAIPVGEIRKHTSWFGLRFAVGSRRFLVAREEPGAAEASTSCCVREGTHADSLEEPRKNETVDGVKGLLNRLAGLPRVDFQASAHRVGYGGRPSFRDMAAFNFLPQHIVANPYTLFFKTETTEHREKLRIIFPLVLGAVDSDYLRAEQELKLVDRLLTEKEAQLNRRRESARAWEAEAFGLYTRAKELSLLPLPEGRPRTLSECLVALRRVAATRELPSYQVGSGGAASEELLRLRERDYRIDGELGDLRRQLVRLQELRDRIGGYRDVLGRQKGRLESLGWFKAALHASEQCPLCLSVTTQARKEVGELEVAAAQLASELATVESTPAVLEREELSVLEEIQTKEEELRGLRKRRSELEESVSEARGRRQRLEEVYRFIGRLEEAISNLDLSSEESNLVGEINGLVERRDGLRRLLDRESSRTREKRSLGLVSQRLGVHSTFLKLERSEDLIELWVPQLTLRFLGEGRKDYLWEIGSGENWMGFHVACLASLHEFFLKRPESPVPSFLIIDQPSQVYFPTGTFDEDDAGDGPAALTSDERKLRRVFEVLADVVRRAEGRLQVLILEHAGERIWQDLRPVNLVERWRGDVDLLIPRDWLEASKS